MITPSIPSAFLPMTKEEMDRRRWDTLDVLLITGDSYIDHPSNGTAVVGRALEQAGFRVGIIARPDWHDARSVTRLGRPNLFVGITAGAVDSTLNNYTANLAKRRSDVYAPDDGSQRPNFATAVYCNLAKAAFPGVTTVIGGIEASTRRFTYYDYLKQKIRRSILLDTRATILVIGPGEQTVVTIAERLRDGRELTDIDGTARLIKRPSAGVISLPSHRAVLDDPSRLIEQTRVVEAHLGPHKRPRFAQEYNEGWIETTCPIHTTSEQLDRTFDLPFLRKPHPSYKQRIPAFETIRWSVITHRGCPGGCSFCAIAYHQGRRIVSRSKRSVLAEINRICRDPDFRGTITDLGGATANGYGLETKNPERCGRCKRPSCLYPAICTNLETSHERFLELLDNAERVTGVKHLFIASGIRHDLALKAPRFIERLRDRHTGGHLKVAPEHCDNNVLKLMRKPPIESMEEFERQFQKRGVRSGRNKQYLVPYFIAGFPGCTPDAANHTATWLNKRGQRLEQVQTFIPLPGTMAAAMYAARKDPDGHPLFVADPRERKRQKSLLNNPSGRMGPTRHKRRS